MEPAEQDLLQILVIDDDADLRDMCSRFLIQHGHQVFAVESAEEGLGLLPYNTFHVAFIDQRLPAMEGLVFGEYLRKNNPHMQIALVTGSDDERLDRLAQQHRITVIRKPFPVHQLLDLVASYRAGAEERRRQRLHHEDPDWGTPLAQFFPALPESFGIPNVPSRIEERLVKPVRKSLTELRSVSRYNERDRVIAFAGLVTMHVLGIKPPKSSSGLTLFEEYDALMRENGRRPEFTAVRSEEDEGPDPE